jgi:hypothetical protein
MPHLPTPPAASPAGRRGGQERRGRRFLHATRARCRRHHGPPVRPRPGARAALGRAQPKRRRSQGARRPQRRALAPRPAAAAVRAGGPGLAQGRSPRGSRLGDGQAPGPGVARGRDSQGGPQGSPARVGAPQHSPPGGGRACMGAVPASRPAVTLCAGSRAPQPGSGVRREAGSAAKGRRGGGRHRGRAGWPQALPVACTRTHSDCCTPAVA